MSSQISIDECESSASREHDRGCIASKLRKQDAQNRGSISEREECEELYFELTCLLPGHVTSYVLLLLR